MGLFDGIFDDEPKNEFKTESKVKVIKSVKIENAENIPKSEVKPIKKSLDPRPDLKSDSQVWTQLLAITQDIDPSFEFYGIMLGFRAIGTRLIMITDRKDPYFGQYRMRGQFDKTGADHWTASDDYRAAAIKYLGPATAPNQYGKMLTELLGKLGLKKVA
jgi:hypothetical protein